MRTVASHYNETPKLYCITLLTKPLVYIAGQRRRAKGDCAEMLQAAVPERTRL